VQGLTTIYYIKCNVINPSPSVFKTISYLRFIMVS